MSPGSDLLVRLPGVKASLSGFAGSYLRVVGSYVKGIGVGSCFTYSRFRLFKSRSPAGTVLAGVLGYRPETAALRLSLPAPVQIPPRIEQVNP
jgi:hypothetical protein